MTTWEYKSVWLERTGRQQDDQSFLGFGGSTWAYTPWLVSGTNQQVPDGLQQLGREGWELVGVMPGDFWSEGTGNRAHALRPISYSLLFKRPLPDTA
jgi:hypothetical protein